MSIKEKSHIFLNFYVDSLHFFQHRPPCGQSDVVLILTVECFRGRTQSTELISSSILIVVRWKLDSRQSECDVHSAHYEASLYVSDSISLLYFLSPHSSFCFSHLGYKEKSRQSLAVLPLNFL